MEPKESEAKNSVNNMDGSVAPPHISYDDEPYAMSEAIRKDWDNEIEIGVEQKIQYFLGKKDSWTEPQKEAVRDVVVWLMTSEHGNSLQKSWKTTLERLERERVGFSYELLDLNHEEFKSLCSNNTDEDDLTVCQSSDWDHDIAWLSEDNNNCYITTGIIMRSVRATESQNKAITWPIKVCRFNIRDFDSDAKKKMVLVAYDIIKKATEYY